MQLRPGQAALISLVCPGLSHVFLGKPVRAALVFVLTFGLFFAGYGICTDRIWFLGLSLGKLGFLPGELHLLIPEILNPLPYLMVHVLQDLETPEALRHIRLPRDGEHLAFWMMGASGFCSMFAAADACFTARGVKSSAGFPVRPAILTWFLPGAGHVVLGQKGKGLLVGGCVVALFVLGLLLSGGQGVDRAARPIWWSGQSPFGGGTLLAALLLGGDKMAEFPGRFFDLGFVLCTTAGLLNVVLMVDAFSIAEQRALGYERSKVGAGADGPATADSGPGTGDPARVADQPAAPSTEGSV